MVKVLHTINIYIILNQGWYVDEIQRSLNRLKWLKIVLHSKIQYKNPVK